LMVVDGARSNSPISYEISRGMSSGSTSPRSSLVDVAGPDRAGTATASIADRSISWLSGENVTAGLGSERVARFNFYFFQFEASSCKACKESVSHVDKELYFRWGCPSFVSVLDPFANLCKVCECGVVCIGGKSGFPNSSVIYCGLHGGSPCRPLTFKWSTNTFHLLAIVSQ